MAITLTSIADTHIRSDDATGNYGTGTYVAVGESNAVAGRVWRGLIKFDLSSLSGKTILSAKLRLCVNADYSDNVRDVSVYRLLREWVENQATWNIAKTDTNWGTAGAANTTSDYNSTALATTSVPASPTVGTWIEWDLSASEIQKFTNGTYTNYGFLLRAATETNDAILYDSREGTNTPQLVVEYIGGMYWYE